MTLESSAPAPVHGRRDGVPAARRGQCECCRTLYAAVTLVVWDSVGLVLAAHRSVSSRLGRPDQPVVPTALWARKNRVIAADALGPWGSV